MLYRDGTWVNNEFKKTVTSGSCLPLQTTTFPTMPHFAGGTGNIRASQVLAWRPVAISASSVGPISFIWLKPSKCSVFQLLGNIGRFVKAELVSSPRKNLKLGGFGPAWRAFVLLSSSLHNLRRRNRVSFFSRVCFVVKMSPWWGPRVWQKWIRAFAAWPALTAARFPPPCFCLMLESSAALCPELGLDNTHYTETNMEKIPNSSTSAKVPPRSSSTGPAPSENKAKTGEDPRASRCAAARLTVEPSVARRA